MKLQTQVCKRVQESDFWSQTDVQTFLFLSEDCFSFVPPSLSNFDRFIIKRYSFKTSDSWFGCHHLSVSSTGNFLGSGKGTTEKTFTIRRTSFMIRTKKFSFRFFV